MSCSAAEMFFIVPLVVRCWNCKIWKLFFQPLRNPNCKDVAHPGGSRATSLRTVVLSKSMQVEFKLKRNDRGKRYKAFYYFFRVSWERQDVWCFKLGDRKRIIWHIILGRFSREIHWWNQYFSNCNQLFVSNECFNEIFKLGRTISNYNHVPCCPLFHLWFLRWVQNDNG